MFMLNTSHKAYRIGDKCHVSWTYANRQLSSAQNDPSIYVKLNSTKSNLRHSVSQSLLLAVLEVRHLIWVLRCEKTINKKKHSKREIKAQWIKAINNRITTDRIIATKVKREENHINMIDQSWKRALEKAGVPHRDWIQKHEVFSG